MRRFAAFSCFILLLLCNVGCHKKEITPPVTTGFSCDFRAVYRELALAGTVTRQAAGTMSLKFTEPETLSGVTATWDGESVKLSLLGLTYTVTPENVPEAALGKELLSVWDAALQGEGKTTKNSDVITQEGICNNHNYTYCYSAKNGMPLSLVVPALPLNITFSM